jgi:cytochrome c553
MRTIVAAMMLMMASSGALADAKVGEKKAQLCLLCHKPGNNIAAAPLLEAQPKEYLVVATTAYKTGKRPSPSMKANTAALSARDIADIADYFAARSPLNSAQPVDAAKAGVGEARVKELNCASCHGESFAGSKLVPRLAGQMTGYLVSQLQAFAAGSREHPPIGTTFGKVGDLDTIAHYLTSLK